MHMVTLICIISAILLAKIQATTAPIPGYGVTDFTWEIETAPGGSKTNVTGTVQEIVANISAINPNWKNDFNLSESGLPHKRLSVPFTGILCNIRISEWYVARRSAIRDGVAYLNSISGTPTNGPGPGNCGRVSCSYQSAIWWCNDETVSLSLPGFASIAAGAQAILDNCPDWANLQGGVLNGQVFAQFLQNWNVIIDSASC
ncbi:hypothetical protein GQ53DRAFT_854953 [Thozetella sp. PMI_491]|nr:hypothetical protein GQ53DRAFT_854953 [Thozetella sp. PMI_491]